MTYKNLKKSYLKLCIIIGIISALIIGFYLGNILNSTSFITAYASEKDSADNEPMGFDDPESAMRFLVDSLKVMDYERAMEAFDIKIASEKFDLNTNINTLGVWKVTDNMKLPTTSDYNNVYNMMCYESYIEKLLSNFILSFFIDPSVFDGRPIAAAEAIPMLQQIDISNISRLELIGLEYANPTVQDSNNYKNNARTQAGKFGADIAEEYVVYYMIDNNQYMGGVTFYIYDGKYYIDRLQSNIIPTQSSWQVSII